MARRSLGAPHPLSVVCVARTNVVADFSPAEPWATMR
jgi:hypothetical protein